MGSNPTPSAPQSAKTPLTSDDARQRWSANILPAAQTGYFDLWRNIVREYGDEFLGNPEHDGDGEPADYRAEPLSASSADPRQ